MDLATIVGVIGALAMLIMTVVTSGGDILTYVDLPSALCVIVGSYLAVMASTSMKNVLGIFKIIGLALKIPNFDEVGTVRKLIAFSDKSRREGLLSLEDDIGELSDEFVKKGLRLAIDGIPGETIGELMELEINKLQERHVTFISLLYHWTGVAPALGMLGTVIGLIAMMKNLEDKSAIGPNMAVALITTLYGAIIANLITNPIAAKLKNMDAREVAAMEMVIEGVLSIQAGDNPRILAMKLMTYLLPADRKVLEAELLKD